MKDLAILSLESTLVLLHLQMDLITKEKLNDKVQLQKLFKVQFVKLGRKMARIAPLNDFNLVVIEYIGAKEFEILDVLRQNASSPARTIQVLLFLRISRLSI